MNLDPTNRWVIYTKEIPWDNLVSVYCKTMSIKQGAAAKNPRLVIGALFIKHILRLSDVDTINMIRENVFMQYFLGLPGYTYPSLFVTLRKRLGIEEFNEYTFILEECARNRNTQVIPNKNNSRNQDSNSRKSNNQGTDNNESKKENDTESNEQSATESTNASVQYKPTITNKHQTKKTAPADQIDDCVKLDEEGCKHKGDMILYATACVADIKFPKDIDLLNDSRESSASLNNTNVRKHPSLQSNFILHPL